MYKSEDYEERLLTTVEVSELVQLGKSTLEHYRLNGGGPPFVLTGRNVRYKLSEVYKWIANQKNFNSTSEYTANKKMKP